MGYIIKCLTNTKNGFIEQVLSYENDWCIATNKALHFRGPVSASKYFMENKDIPLRGSSIWIEGPKGGRYMITVGRTFK